MNARDLAARFNLRKHGQTWRGTCPACGYRNALSLTESKGKALWWCASCQNGNALAAIIRRAAGPHDLAGRHAAAAEPTTPADTLRRAVTLWDATLPIPGTLAEAYLHHRGVRAALDRFPPGERGAALRHLPRCWCSDTRAHLPAMIAAIRDPGSGELRAVHRTYLAQPGRKADLPNPKKSLGSWKGAAILLHAPAAGLPLVLAEGIETALAASVILDAPAWSAVAAGNLPRIALPEDISDIVIAADPGRAGEGAAADAARRWTAEGRRVRIALPDDRDADFADLLSRRALRGEVSHAR